jgi:phosphoserine phosphatase
LEEWVNTNDVNDETSNRSNRTEVLQYLALMESRAAHPVAQAILAGTRNEGVSIPTAMILQRHTIIAGEGVVGVINGLDVHVGNERLFERLGLLDKVPAKILDSVSSWKQLGGTIGFMSIEGRGIVCAYCAADAVRPEAARVVAKLKQRGIRVTMLTGDNDDTAQAIGKQLGLDGPDQICSKLLPEEKLAFVERLGEDTHLGRSALFSLCSRSSIVLFCGDGVNDAPAIAAANVGVAMGAGAALAMETADVTLLDSDLEKLFYSLDMGRRVIRKIWENIVFSISVKFLVLGFTLAGRTHLWAAIASDVGAMILVTLNSMMLMPVRRGSKIQTGAISETKKIEDVEKGQGAKHFPPQSFDVAKSSCANGCCGNKAPPEPPSQSFNVAKGSGAKGCYGSSAKPTLSPAVTKASHIRTKLLQNRANMAVVAVELVLIRMNIARNSLFKHQRKIDESVSLSLDDTESDKTRFSRWYKHIV